MILAAITRIAVVLVLIAIALSIFTMLVRTRKEPAMVDTTAALPRIAVMEIMHVPVSRQWQGFGTARPSQGGAANVPAQVRGVIDDIPPGVVAGAAVKRGQVLMRIDDADYRYDVEATRQRIAEIDSQIEQLAVEFRSWIERLELAQEDIKIARSDLDRVLLAQERGSATQREVDQLRTALIVAHRNEIQVREQLERIEPRQGQLHALKAQHQAALQLAQRNLDRCTITSPIDGILQAVDVERGESVGVDQRVARVVDLRRIEVPLRLPAASRASIRTGDEAILQSAGASQSEWSAVISRIAPEDDQTSRTVTVYVEVEQESDDATILTPGKFVQGVINSSDVRDRVVLPRRAVHADRVWIVDDAGYLRSRRIETVFSMRASFPQFGIDDLAWVVTSDTLLPGSLIVLDGARSLVEGSRIEPVLPDRNDGEGMAARKNNDHRADRETEHVVP